MFESVLQALEKRQYEVLIFAGLVFFAAWLYREFRNSFLETRMADQERIEIALSKYGELQLELYNYFENKENTHLELKIAAVYPYITRKLLNKIIDWKEKQNDELARVVLEAINLEICRLKQLQLNSAVRQLEDVLDKVEFSLQSNFDSFIQPLIQVTFSLAGLAFLVLVFIKYGTVGWQGKVFIVTFLFNSYTYLILLAVILERMLFGRFKHSKGNWVKLVLLVIAPIFLFVSHSWIAGIIQAVLSWVYVIFFLQGMSKKN